MLRALNIWGEYAKNLPTEDFEHDNDDSDNMEDDNGDSMEKEVNPVAPRRRASHCQFRAPRVISHATFH